ncbi:MAG: YidC/Oxa1 family membrane protein insertase [bacterium]|nr:YidC/Oxa1 family membrane protein insertase [bacterium]
MLTKPLLNILIWFYNVIPGQDMGLAIIALTLLIRLILFPSFQKSLRSQRELQKLQPKLNEIKEKYKNDKETQTKATLEFYKENKVNPFSSCLPLLVQLPILIALYRVFLTGLNGEVSNELYAFVADPGAINTSFLGLVELGKSNIWFALAAGIFQFIQSKMIAPPKTGVPDKTASIMNAQLTYFMPVVTVLISMRLPAGLALYWAVTTLFAIGQQYYIMRTAKI